MPWSSTPSRSWAFPNSAPFKTSDQSNAMKWLCKMFVYECKDLLHLGRAIPRAWLAEGHDIFAQGVATRFGNISVRYRSKNKAREISAEIDFDMRQSPGRFLVRFRHPEGLPIQGVTVDGNPWRAFDARSGDVEIRQVRGNLQVAARY